MLQHELQSAQLALRRQSIVDFRTQVRAAARSQLFLNSRFYGGDIVLEDEPAFDCVAFSLLDLQNRGILYNRACQSRDLPSTYSASPEPVQLSGVLARACTIKKCVHPQAQTLSDLRFLWNLAEEHGLPIHTFAFKESFGIYLEAFAALRRAKGLCSELHVAHSMP